MNKLSLNNTDIGKKVRFTDKDGYSTEREEANKYLNITPYLYTIKNIEVDRWYSSVELVEVPGKWFNTVMFEVVKVEL